MVIKYNAGPLARVAKLKYSVIHWHPCGEYFVYRLAHLADTRYPYLVTLGYPCSDERPMDYSYEVIAGFIGNHELIEVGICI